jgi:thioredoxin 1
MSALDNVTDTTFSQAVLNQDGLVLVDFWAPWCGPCRMLGPTLEQIQGEMGDAVKIVKINVDENPQVASKYRVMNIPLMLMFKGGEVVDQLMGNMPKNTITTAINRNR